MHILINITIISTHSSAFFILGTIAISVQLLHNVSKNMRELGHMREKKKKPIHKNWWFWVIGIIVVVSWIINSADEEQTNGQTQEANIKQEEQTDEPKVEKEESKQEKVIELGEKITS